MATNIHRLKYNASNLIYICYFIKRRVHFDYAIHRGNQIVEKTFITVQIPKSVKKEADKKAKKQGVSLTYYVRVAIEEKNNE